MPGDFDFTDTHLGADPLDEHDEAILGRLADLWQVLDPVPAGLASDLSFAVALDELYTEVARIRQSSDGLVGVRGASDVDREDRTITFSTDRMDLTIMVVTSARSTVRIDGWVEPGGSYDVVLRVAGTTRRTAANGGRFCFDGVPTGSIQILVTAGGADGGNGHDMVTPTLDL